MVYSRDMRCGALSIEVNSNWIHTAIAEMGYQDQEDDEWDWKFHRYCEDMELEIYREHSRDNYSNFNWGDWFMENYNVCEYFDDLFTLEEDDDSVSGEVDSVGSY